MIDIEKLNWVKINLQYNPHYNFETKPKTDWSSLEKRQKEVFGTTVDELRSLILDEDTKYFISHQDSFKQKYAKEFGLEKIRNFEWLEPFWSHYDTDLIISKIKKYQQLVRDVALWALKQPEDIENRKLNDEWIKEQDKKSFINSGFNKLGTIFQLENGQYYLSGTYDTEDIKRNDIVVRYALIIDFNKLNNFENI